MATKYQLPEGQKLATFKIDEENWEAFKALCDSQGTSASKALNNFIKNSLDAGQLGAVAQSVEESSQSLDIDIDALESRLMARFESRLQEAITGK